MIKFVTNKNRHLYKDLLDQMHRDRKLVFVDWLKWDVPVVDGREGRGRFSVGLARGFCYDDVSSCQLNH